MHEKTAEEIAIMTEAGKRLARVLSALSGLVKPGARTIDIDHRAYDLITAGGDTPSFLGYQPGGAGQPYPATICASVNDCVVHGLPNAVALRDGDVVSLDVGLKHKGYHADMAITLPVGKISREAKQLLSVTERAMHLGIESARPGKTLGDIGYAVQSYVESHGFGVVRVLTGHGIGRKLHEAPHVYNFGKKGEGEVLVPGMVIAIEPMVTTGKYQLKQLPDDSFVTKDGSLSAHFEHTIVITARGPKILTA